MQGEMTNRNELPRSRAVRFGNTELQKGMGENPGLFKIIVYRLRLKHT